LVTGTGSPGGHAYIYIMHCFLWLSWSEWYSGDVTALRSFLHM